MKIIRGTTPRLSIRLRQGGEAQAVIFSIRAGETVIGRRVTDIPADGVYHIGLTQEETLSMQPGRAVLEAQINYPDGNVAKSERFLIKVRDTVATERVGEAEGTLEEEEITLTVASDFTLRACNNWSETTGIGAVAQLGGNVASGMQSAALGKESYAASPIGTTEGYLTTVVPCTRYLTDEVSMDYDAATGKLTFAYAGEGEAPEGNVFVVYRCYIVELDNYIYRRAMLGALPAQVELSAEGTIDTDADGSFFMKLLFAGEVDGEVMDGTITTESLDAPRAVGYATVAVGKSAEASGYLTVAWKPCSHAEGYRTRAMGDAAHAEGAASEALADRAHAEGNTTVASGAAAHSEGGMTRARGDWTHAEGIGTVADAWAGHVQGCYNELDTGKRYLHIVGNGSSDEHRSNAHTLDKMGNAWYAGSVACRAPRSGSEAVTLDYAEDLLAGRLTDKIAFLRGVADEGAAMGNRVSFYEGLLPPGKPHIAGRGAFRAGNIVSKNAEVVKKVQWVPKNARDSGKVGLWLCAERFAYALDANGFLPVTADWNGCLRSLVRGVRYVANSSAADASFLVKNTAGANEKHRYCDAAREVVYKFDLATYPNAFVVLEVCQNYLVQVSPDNQNWTTVQNYEVASGKRISSDKNAVQIGISALRWAPSASEMYIRIANTDTTSGFGGAISGFTVYSGIGQDATVMIEFTNSGKPDVNEIAFKLDSKNNTLEEGWKFYQLDLRHATSTSEVAEGAIGYSAITGTYPDLKNLNFFRVYGSWDLWRITVGQCAVMQGAAVKGDTEFFA